jgi:peroxiredoxin
MYEQFQAEDTEVLVIGCGSVRDAGRVARMFKLPFPVLSDPERALYPRYDLDKALVVIQRSGTFLVDKQGIVRYIHQATNPRGSVEEAELLKEVEKLRG